MTSGILCNKKRQFHLFLPSQLFLMPQDSNLTAIQTIGDRNFDTDALWEYNDKLIMRSSMNWENYRILQVDQNSLQQSYVYFNKYRVYALFSALTDSLSITIEDNGSFDLDIYVFYHQSYSNSQMERETLKLEADTRPDALLVYQIEWGKNRVYTTYSPAGLIFIKVDETGQYPSYSNLAYIFLNSSNCATVLAASDAYLAAACPNNNIITIYNTTSFEQICSVSGQNGAILGSQLVIYQDKDVNGASTMIATLFASGFLPSSDLHFVTHMKIVPSSINNLAYCFISNTQSDYPVSHTLSSGSTSLQLQIGITQNNFLVYLKTPGEVFSSDRRALYFAPLDQFSINHPHFCPYMHYSTSPLSAGQCFPCSETVNATEYPARSLLQQKSCCSSMDGHGPLCLNCTQYISSANLPKNSQWINDGIRCTSQCLPGFSIFQPTGLCQNSTLLTCASSTQCICPQYMNSIGISLPENSEWIIDAEQNCSSQCLPGYSKFSASGLCQTDSFLQSIRSDPCYNQNTCHLCDLSSCYFTTGGECIPGSLSRLEALHSINQQCIRGISFCGQYQTSIDLSQAGNVLRLIPKGHNGLKTMRGTLCEWKVTPINPQGSIQILKKSNSTDEAFLINSTEQFELLYNDESKVFNVSKGIGLAQQQFIIGVLFYEDLQFSSIEIVVRPEEIDQTSSSASSDTNIVLIVSLLISALCIVALIIVIICCVRQKRRLVRVFKFQRKRFALSPQAQARQINAFHQSSRNEMYKSELKGQCTICFDKLDHRSVSTECNHTFHEQCLKNWLRAHSTCPLCRANLRK